MLTLGNRVRFDKDARAAVREGDPTALLLAEHEWLFTVLDELEPAILRGAAEDRAALASTLAQLKAIVDLHIRKEEEVYLPAVAALNGPAPTPGMDPDMMVGEHDAIRIRQDELAETVQRGEGAGAAFAAFRRALTVHFGNEEAIFFDEAAGTLIGDAGRDVIARMQQLDDEGAGAA